MLRMRQGVQGCVPLFSWGAELFAWYQYRKAPAFVGW